MYIPGEGCRYIDGEVPTWEVFDPVLEKCLEKDIPVLEKSMHNVTFSLPEEPLG